MEFLLLIGTILAVEYIIIKAIKDQINKDKEYEEQNSKTNHQDHMG